MSERKPISKNTEKLLWGMSAGRCEKCGRLLYMHPFSKTIGNFAQIAHNIPVGEEGPRSKYKQKYYPIDKNLDINDVGNLLLLCYDCHQEIDKINPSDYSPGILKRIKADFEEFIVKATNLKRVASTIVLKYSPNLHGKQIQITGVQKALFPDKVIDKEIDLTLMNSMTFVGDKNYWEIEINNLTQKYNQRLIPFLEDYKNGIANISVFAIGPIPLLVKLGQLLSNKQEVDVYQLKKAPVSTWEWEDTNDDTEYEIKYLQESHKPVKIIILLSISGQIRYQETKEALSWDNATVIEVVTNHQQHDDFLRNKKQLEKFIICYRKLKEKLRSENEAMIHMFAAVPVSIAVEIGKQWNSTFDLPLTVYNYTNKKYEPAVIIGGEHNV